MVQQLLISLNTILNSFCCHSQTQVLYLGVKKAFDRIPHNDFLLKIWHCRICGKLWLWFKSYLSSHTLCVSVRDQTSDFLQILSGVPQGSILHVGPLLFLIYINYLPSALLSSFPLMFVDNSKILQSISKPSDCLLLQRNINSLSLWKKKSKLEFNCSKFVFAHAPCRDPHITNDNVITDNPILCKSIHRTGCTYVLRLKLDPSTGLYLL